MEPKILNFTDYRAYLKAYYDYKKSCNSSWSYAVWARLLDLANSSVIHKIIHGQRNLGELVAHKLVSYLKFTSHETEYFKRLIAYEKYSTDPELKEILKDDLDSFLQLKKFELISFRQDPFWSKGHVLILKNFIRLFPHLTSPQAIAEKLLFVLSEQDITMTIELLKENNIISESEEGFVFLETDEARFFRWEGGESDAVKNLNLTFLKVAYDVFSKERSQMPAEPFFGALSFAIDKQEIGKADEDLHKFYRHFSTKYGKSQAADKLLYQFQMQLFPVTRPYKLPHKPGDKIEKKSAKNSLSG